MGLAGLPTYGSLSDQVRREKKGVPTEMTHPFKEFRGNVRM